jgi:hypothetical protein
LPITQPADEAYGAPEEELLPVYQETSAAQPDDSYDSPSLEPNNALDQVDDGYGAPAEDSLPTYQESVNPDNSYDAPAIDDLPVYEPSNGVEESPDSYVPPLSEALDDGYGSPEEDALPTYQESQPANEAANVDDSYGAPAAEETDDSYNSPSIDDLPSYGSTAANEIDSSDSSYAAPADTSYDSPPSDAYAGPLIIRGTYSSTSSNAILADKPSDSYKIPETDYNSPAEDALPTYQETQPANDATNVDDSYDAPAIQETDNSYSSPTIDALPSYENTEAQEEAAAVANSGAYDSPQEEIAPIDSSYTSVESSPEASEESIDSYGLRYFNRCIIIVRCLIVYHI